MLTRNIEIAFFFLKTMKVRIKFNSEICFEIIGSYQLKE